MKKTLLLSISIILCTVINAQKGQFDVSHSFNKQTGMNIYQVTKSGFIWGLGGSYLFSTYTGETKSKYQELASTYLGKDGNVWSNAFRTNYNVQYFTENRGTVKLLLGKEVNNKTAIFATMGLAFRSEYWKGTGYDFMPQFTSPAKNFYTYRNTTPKALIGINVSHLITRDLGMNLGWDNISGVTYGITINMKHSGWFKD